MPFTARLRLDESYAPEITREADGLRGIKHYEVDTADETGVCVGPVSGLPVIGEAWGPDLGSLRAVRINYRYMGGSWTLARVEYETPNRRGRLPTPEVNLAYTEWQPSVVSVVRRDGVVDPGFVGPTLPINNGEGTPVDVTQVTLLVHQFRSIADDIPLDLFLRLGGGLADGAKVNANPVILPPLYGHAQYLEFGPGQLRYRQGYAKPASDTIMEIVHEMVAAPNPSRPGAPPYAAHFAVWRGEDEKGNITTTEQWSQVYETAVFPSNFY